MSKAADTSARQKQVDRFMLAGNAGMLAFIGIIVCGIASYRPMMGEVVFMGWVGTVAIVLLFILIASFIYMIWRRRADEFTLAIWHSGVTFAFFAVIAWGLLAHFPESIAEREIARSTGEPVEDLNLVAGLTTEVALLAYFIGFQFKRLRGNF